MRHDETSSSASPADQRARIQAHFDNDSAIQAALDVPEEDLLCQS